MGASSDGIINCNCCGKGCLEIKCPYSLSQGNDIENLDYLTDGNLKNNHPYFYQVQTQMLICGVNYADFVIWSPNNYHIECININHKLCNEIIIKSKWFFYEAILPELLGRFVTTNADKNLVSTTNQQSFIGQVYPYCMCKTDKGGKMLMCSQEGCLNLWYHYTCLGIKRKPNKNWKCSTCK